MENRAKLIIDNSITRDFVADLRVNRNGLQTQVAHAIGAGETLGLLELLAPYDPLVEALAREVAARRQAEDTRDAAQALATALTLEVRELRTAMMVDTENAWPTSSPT